MSKMTEEDARIFEKTQLSKTTSPKPFKISKADLEGAIDSYSGLTFDMCNALGCTPRQLYSQIDKHGLRDMMKEARVQLVKQAESVIHKALTSSNEKTQIEAARFILERLGKEEWGTSPQIQQQINVVDKEVELKNIFGV